MWYANQGIYRLLYSRYNKTEVEMNALEGRIAKPMAVKEIGTDAEQAYGYRETTAA